MPDMKFIQLSTSEFKLDSVVDFGLSSSGNCMVLIGNSNDVPIFEMKYSCDIMILMPYSTKPIQVSQHKPISEVIRNIDLVHIYRTSTVQESQELALNLIYTADCTAEPLRAKALQAGIINVNNTNICCILTTYGYCEIFKKDFITEDWKPLDTNLPKILITEVFPLNISPSHIKTFSKLKMLTNKFIITCFALSMQLSDMIIYLGTAAGYVVALKYNETSRKFELYCSLKTSLNNTSYITKFNDLLLVGCDEGKVLLLKMDFKNIELQELEYLWSKPDRMSCRKAFISYDENLRSYLVVFSKAAHLLAYSLDAEGSILSSSTLYVSGIKITGIETISNNEFIITTVVGTIKYIKIVCPTKEELHFEEYMVDHDFDSSNYQILGLAASLSKNLWSFLIYRNKDYVHQSKYFPTTAFANVCKLNGQNSFEKLVNFNSKYLDNAQDLIMEVNLDIFNNLEYNKYMEYLTLEEIKQSDEINDAFLQKLQIKIIITRKMAIYQNIKYKKPKIQTKLYLEILEPVLQLIHILERLRYLQQQHRKEVKFSKFQELSIACMHLQFTHSMNEIAAINTIDEEVTINSVVKMFSEYFNREIAKIEIDTSSFGQSLEYCSMCKQHINSFKKCEEGHDIKRCSISCTQLTLFETKYCPLCYTLARNDDEAKLDELYATDDYITCIYCRFLFKSDEF